MRFSGERLQSLSGGGGFIVLILLVILVFLLHLPVIKLLLPEKVPKRVQNSGVFDQSFHVKDHRRSYMLRSFLRI